MTPRGWGHNLVTREEGFHPILDPAVGLRAVDSVLCAVVGRLLEEEEDDDDAEAGQAHGPPVLDGPVY